ncbi:amino acid ABC transporter permease [Acidocella aminolytica]|jgi:polar amino acid transport system permease protein|uniref:Putative glutamine transport system permease protein GlnP n=1 Tax=Acidocella aminolytica 101 = DSM 11237 TaxID=1120923 RepID=A0A0D6PCT7_9PROT|nr:amino acid ABC transporter permease [Acidocella aminolytica]GAN79033.1 ABC transporter polar amino acid permease inner membrane subunit [Acidocella aminolytica 101 = DSM 11237]GBQ32173.1 amino acid ABC transporter permease [Acidocella aminolytica 101 = DSM 11237]SHF15735.1 polar amino acid transport system permease protein [Acidocella aminolytica 101 = DSM 11237]
MNVVWQNLPVILGGLALTIQYSIVAIILMVIIGLFAALMRLSTFAPFRWISSAYVEMFRSTPLLVQLFFIVLGLPAILPVNQWFGQLMYPILAAALTLSLNEGAYVTEIIRAGILGVDRGQKEAAMSIGMTGFQTMRYIVLPQAFKRMIPPLVNQAAQTIKDTSLLAPVGVAELVYKGEIVIAATFASFTIWALVALLYFIVIFSVSKCASYMERRLQVDKR